jgi:hypothetical protein
VFYTINYLHTLVIVFVFEEEEDDEDPVGTTVAMYRSVTGLTCATYAQSGQDFLPFLLLLLLPPPPLTLGAGFVRTDWTGHVHSPFETESISSSPLHGHMAQPQCVPSPPRVPQLPPPASCLSPFMSRTCPALLEMGHRSMSPAAHSLLSSTPDVVHPAPFSLYCAPLAEKRGSGKPLGTPSTTLATGQAGPDEAGHSPHGLTPPDNDWIAQRMCFACSPTV